VSSGGLRKLSIGSTPVAGRPRFFCKADTDVSIFSSYKNCAGQTRGSNLSSALTTTELPRVFVPSKHVRERVDYDEPRLDAADDGDEPAPDGGCTYQRATLPSCAAITASRPASGLGGRLQAPVQLVDIVFRRRQRISRMMLA
jgi:hypothetical protein